MSVLPQRKKSTEEITRLRENLGVPPLQASDAPAEIAENPSPAPQAPTPARTLPKSEQAPAPLTQAAKSGLPSRRHSDDEIGKIRQREIIAQLAPPPPNPKLAAAHPALLVPGYLFAIGGTACFFLQDIPIAATAGSTLTALIIAAFISLTKPISIHHAGFIAVIALMVLVFGTLHYFPQLRHAT